MVVEYWRYFRTNSANKVHITLDTHMTYCGHTFLVSNPHADPDRGVWRKHEGPPNCKNCLIQARNKFLPI